MSGLGKFAADLIDVNKEALSHPHISILTSQYSGCQSGVGCRGYRDQGVKGVKGVKSGVRCRGYQGYRMTRELFRGKSVF